MKYRITRNLGKDLLEKLGKEKGPVEGTIVDLTAAQAEILGSNAEPVNESKKPDAKPERKKPETKPAEPKPE